MTHFDKAAPEFVANSAKNKWYKNPFVWVFVLGFPAFTLVACVLFVIFSFSHQDATVRDDWYMDGKALFQDASRDKLAHDLQLSAVLKFMPDGGGGDRVVLTLKNANPDMLWLRISHATNEKLDRELSLMRTEDGVYTGDVVLDKSVTAKYYLVLSNGEFAEKGSAKHAQASANTKGIWRLQTAARLPAGAVQFLPLRAFD